MPVSRYTRNNITVTYGNEYKEILKNREANYITHFSFEPYRILRLRDVASLDIINHTWVSSDRFYKLSSEHYGDPRYWWIIAYYNGTPLESDVEIGATIKIPKPLAYILNVMGY